VIQLKDMKRGLYTNADKYYREVMKDKVVIEGLELKVGARFKASISAKGGLKKFYMMVISLDPEVIAYWIEGEYAIYLEPIDFIRLLKKRDINKRTANSANLHPQNFRAFTTKALNAAEVRTILWNLPRLLSSDVTSTPNALVLKSPNLVYDFADYVTAGKEPIEDWLFSLAEEAKASYHTGKAQSVLTDDQYDELKDYLVMLNPKRAAALQKPGAPVDDKVKKKVQLEYKMGSLTKIKPDGVSTQKFLRESKDSEYVLTDKLDGLSFQLKYVDCALTQATTRGDGEVGQDITKHVHLIPTVPKKLPPKFKGQTWNIRAEGILTNSDFELLKNTDPKREYANPRNLVAGAVNRNVPNERVLKKLNVVCYAIMSHEKTLDKKDQLATLKAMGFHVVNYQVLKAKEVNEQHLTDYIHDRKKQGDFDLDGAVIEANNAKIRQQLGNETNSIDPRYARAFKVGDTERIEAHVEEVLWEVSKHGKLKPRIRIKPTKLGGVTVTYATAFNAAFVYDNKLGPGAKVLLTRSGDVIPHIIKVLVKANKAQMPDKKVFGEWSWNETEVDIVIVDAGENETVRVKQITNFFTKIGVDYLGQGIVQKFFDAGLDDIDKVINTSIPELMGVDGIQRKGAEKLYNGIIEALARVDLPTLAAATPFFGENFGETRLNKIYEEYGDKMFSMWSGNTIGEVAAKIAAIKGFSEETGKQFAKGIKPFNSFLQRNSSRIKVQKKKVIEKTSAACAGISICWTGIRQHDVEEFLVKNGGTVASGVKSGLTYLVAKDPNSGSSKNVKAQGLGVKVVGPNQIMDILKSKGAK
jgi:DNA ligase (NAD+)